jgi:hypothetical protein
VSAVPGPAVAGDLRLVPVAFRQACAFVAAHHRHHGPPQGMKFAIGVTAADGALAGVVIAGRPVARYLDDGLTVEVTRTCTRGAANANSMLYAAAWRAARALGYRRAITYTRAGESGASLRAAGWQPVATCPPNAGWDRPGRPRRPSTACYIARTRWQAPSPDRQRQPARKLPGRTSSHTRNGHGRTPSHP